MKKLLIAILSIVFNLSTVSAQVTFQKDFDKGSNLSVQPTSDGGYIMTGGTNSTVGGDDVFLKKSDANGAIVWSKSYGGTNSDWGNSVLQTTDGGYIVAGSTMSFAVGLTDFYVIKTDSIGDTLWTKVYGTFDQDDAYAIQKTNDGGYFILGNTGNDVYLVKINSTGDTLWTKKYNSSNGDRGWDAQQTADGGYIIVGEEQSIGIGGSNVYLIKTDNIGDTLWTRAFGGIETDVGFSVIQTAGGEYIIAGQTYSFGVGLGDVYLIKTDSNGNMMWSKTYGSPKAEGGSSVQQTNDGGYIIAGFIQNNAKFSVYDNMYVIKTDSIGDTLWTKYYGESNDSRANSVYQTADGGYIIGGYISGDDGYLIKIDANGYSGCNEFATTTIIGNASTVVDTPVTIINTGAIVTNPATLIHTLTVIENDACGTTTGLAEITKEYNISISPNPNNGMFFYELTTKQTEHLQVHLINIFGERIRKVADNRILGFYRQQVELQNLPKGLYFLQIQIGENIYMKKLIKN